MTIKVLDAGGVTRTITSMKVMDGTTLRTIRTVKVQDGATLRTVATFTTPMTATASAASVSGFTSGGGVCTTASVTVTPSGGLAPYTYAWVRLSGNGEANSPAMASTTFRHTLTDGQSTSGVFRCTVTDSAAQTATADVTANFTDIGGIL